MNPRPPERLAEDRLAELLKGSVNSLPRHSRPRRASRQSRPSAPLFRKSGLPDECAAHFEGRHDHAAKLKKEGKDLLKRSPRALSKSHRHVASGPSEFAIESIQITLPAPDPKASANGARFDSKQRADFPSPSCGRHDHASSSRADIVRYRGSGTAVSIVGIRNVIKQRDVEATIGKWMPGPLTERAVIIGNSGSGKSTLAEAIANLAHIPAIDLDLLHWEQDGWGSKRNEDVARKMVLDLSDQPRWIIEGAFGWLAEVAVRRATALIWLDFPWSLCRAGLLARGLRRGATIGDAAELMKWAEAYWTRQTPSSFAGHSKMFNDFSGIKLRMESREQVAQLLENLRVNMTGVDRP